MLGLLQINGLIKEAAGKLIPGHLVVAHLLGHGLGHAAAEFFIAPRPAGATEHGELTGQAPLAEQLKQGRDQLAVGEVAAGAKDDDALGRDHPLLAKPHP